MIRLTLFHNELVDFGLRLVRQSSWALALAVEARKLLKQNE